MIHGCDLGGRNGPGLQTFARTAKSIALFPNQLLAFFAFLPSSLSVLFHDVPTEQDFCCGMRGCLGQHYGESQPVKSSAAAQDPPAEPGRQGTVWTMFDIQSRLSPMWLSEALAHSMQASSLSLLMRDVR